MGELLASVLTDYLDHVAKDCGYTNRISITYIRNEEASNVYEVYYSEPSKVTNLLFGEYRDDELIEMVMIVVGVMKSFKAIIEKNKPGHEIRCGQDG